MMDEPYFKRIMTTIILAVLIILSFFIIRPILLSVIVGLILAFIFTPIYDFLNKKIKFGTITATLISGFLILIIILILWFLTPIIIDQALKIYLSTQQMDFVAPLKEIFPSIFSSKEFSSEIGTIIHSFVTKSINSFLNSVSGIILNFPQIMLQLFVAFFTFFFVLRDKEKIISYVKSMLPFSKEIEKKLFEQTKGITVSVLYGQIVIGILQGLIAGAGFFIFKVPNALLLTLLACIAGVFPIIGTTVVWVPVAIYLLFTGATFGAVGVTIFGLISVFIDNILKPVMVSQRTNLPSSIILIGMVGGFFFFGVLGFVLGPLILAYLLIILEVYRNKRVPGLLVQEPPSKLRISI